MGFSQIGCGWGSVGLGLPQDCMSLCSTGAEQGLVKGLIFLGPKLSERVVCTMLAWSSSFQPKSLTVSLEDCAVASL